VLGGKEEDNEKSRSERAKNGVSFDEAAMIDSISPGGGKRRIEEEGDRAGAQEKKPFSVFRKPHDLMGGEKTPENSRYLVTDKSFGKEVREGGREGGEK